jgi:hypothetical protein
VLASAFDGETHFFFFFFFLHGFGLGPERSGQRPHLVGNNRISSPGSRLSATAACFRISFTAHI